MELLPQSVIRELAKNVAQELDPTSRMSASACLLLNKAAVNFLHYVAATANDFTLAKGHSVIGCTEILEAMTELGFHNLTQGSEAFLEGFLLL